MLVGERHKLDISDLSGATVERRGGWRHVLDEGWVGDTSRCRQDFGHL